MDPRRRWPRLALALLGGLELLMGYAIVRDLIEGYWPGTYLFHVGLLALLLAGLPTVLAQTEWYPDRRGVITVGLALGGLYLLAVGLLWAGLVPPPYFPADPSVLGLAVDRLGVLLLLTPIAVGYVLGATANEPAPASRTHSPSRSRRQLGAGRAPEMRRSGNLFSGAPDFSELAILAAFFAPLLGTILVMLGPGGEYIGPPFFLYWVALLTGGIEAAPFYLIARWGYGDGISSKPFTTTCLSGSN